MVVVAVPHSTHTIRVVVYVDPLKVPLNQRSKPPGLLAFQYQKITPPEAIRPKCETVADGLRVTLYKVLTCSP